MLVKEVIHMLLTKRFLVASPNTTNKTSFHIVR